ncbi:polysaccharide biosynthesis tyrosine autokinase [Bythopirellula goksoeyrii]|uniref:Tyrosine-protein kinase in cps region n=1 Tax=Bythopirellula goksoeyrii TaxID=1400387 RepID=A0A5B9Q854_9BACT|nr:polysaccharide biosynthesis tyrosine autokinase [Bythopirellula goksoeyrii]QEG33755.1 Putative tyrosine-protein kinase in cps region [Bythopirellula goksoeyrii]
MKQDSGFNGSEVMYPPMAVNHGPNQSMVPANAPYATPGNGGFPGGPPRGPEILTGPLNQTWIMNCLRRRWLSALLLGTLGAILAGLLLMWLFPLSSQVVAYLQVEDQESEDMLGEKTRTMNPKEFEIFQQTQLTLLKSQFVLMAALNRGDIRELNAVVKNRPDELTWLQDELRVSFPGESKILMISYEGDEDPKEMKMIIDAVVDAYKQEVLAAAEISKSETHLSMDKLHKQLLVELRGKIDKMQTLQKELKGAGSPNASAELNMLIRDVGSLNQRIFEAKEQLVDLEVNRELQARALTSPTAMKQAIDAELDADPTIQGYQQEQYALSQQLRQLQSLTKRPSSPEIKRLQQGMASVREAERQYRAQRERDLAAQLKNAPNDAMQQVMTEYIMRRNALNQSITDLQNDLDTKKEEIEALGQENGELSMLTAEVESLQEIERQMDWRLRSWKVQEASPDRIKVMQNAFSTEKINVYQRYAIASIGGLAAFCLTCYGVALLEFRRRKLNSPEDVDEGLGIRVLGVLPSVASRKAMAPGSTTAAQLAESIDNVRATLMHDSTSRPRQIVLVASPSSMEGSTTVASHLALSLTRAGRRTLLIDGDLRDPSLHKLFGMPLEDGVSELVRSEIEIADAVRPTSTEGLWLMTAGQCDMDAIHALATDQLQPIFEKLRGEFDFVIIDGAPILGLSDSLSIGQYIDGAILTVLRDHSGVRSIHQASELLKNLGIRLIGCVVNGMPFKADRRITRIQSGQSKAKRIAAAKEE